MAAEDLVVDNGGDREAIEAVCECLPQFDREPTLAFVVEAVNPSVSRRGSRSVTSIAGSPRSKTKKFVSQSRQTRCLRTHPERSTHREEKIIPPDKGKISRQAVYEPEST